MLKCLILEDEKAAWEILEAFISKTPFLTCLGVYESGLDIPPSELDQADLLFLDIHLPEINGISFLKTLLHPPQFIITSAYANYAIEAFELATLDYLVKPFAYDRFFKAVARAQKQIDFKPEAKDTLLLYANKTTYRVDIQDILYLEAQVDYVNVVTNSQEILILDSLQNWENKLKEQYFVRIHRSYLVNLKQIKKATSSLVYISKRSFPIGRTYRDRFLQSWRKSI